MPFTILPAIKKDCQEIAQIQLEACSTDPGFSTIFPSAATPEAVEFFAKTFRDGLANDANAELFKAVDEATGRIASFVRWHYFTARSSDDPETVPADYDFPNGANTEAGNLLIRNGNLKRIDIMGGQPYAYLSVLCTASEYRKQGAGSSLIAAGLSIADRQGLPSYVEGTPIGRGIYERHGFREVDRLELMLKPWRTENVYNICMIRPTSK